MKRASGVLMPMFSLPDKYGIGTLGSCAFEFIDFLEAAGQHYWQLLPLGPSSCGDSPYSASSSFAGNPYYIDLTLLEEQGLLEKSELEGLSFGSRANKVDYESLRLGRERLLRTAFQRGREKLGDELMRFCRENTWVETYAMYMALKAHFDMLSWTEWPEDIRLRKPDALRVYRLLLSGDIDYHIFVQYLFYSQFASLRAYAKSKGIDFIGDIPIYVALDSADVWSEPQFFLLDENALPTLVAGVPPDDFCEEGQLWGNPLYNWDAITADGYGWWIRRIEGAGKLYDMLRIDHFRGIESYWAVPAGSETALNGRWVKGPGLPFAKVLREWFYPMSFIAEDLGVLTDEVRQLVKDSEFPGMKVLEFAFDSDGSSLYLPHNCTENSICYLGTHDNNTVLGWLEDSEKKDIDYARDYMHITPDEGWCWGMIRSGMATASKLFIVQMQDLLELGAGCRTNIPGVALGNWCWRMLPGAASSALAEKLLEYTRRYRRTDR